MHNLYDHTHYVMENGENQHTFIRRSEIAFPSERQCGKVRQRQTNLMKSVFDSISRFATMFDAERWCLILRDDI